MELLCPAGNIIAAYSAFKGGADAIYIGGKRFSARASAANFSDEEIKEIVFYAHSIGKKVYVTLNTLLFQDEFMEAVSFANYLYSINIDGLIIQDLGLANYLHKTIPGLPLNASTQMNVHNIKQAEALVNMGFKRIVLARESNIEFVKRVKALGVEVEVFGHGALCVSYSGNCLLSSFIGGRSGNRGRCAQPCRMRYDLLEDGKTLIQDKFAISTKDLMTIDNIPELINAGVDSLKIEGRLKSNEYIYSVSKAYRHAIDAVIEHKKNNLIDIDKEELKKIFNRQFTKGYIFDETPFNLLNMDSSSHIGEPIGKVIKAGKNRVSIQLSKTVHRLDGIRFNNKGQFGLTIEKMFVNKNPVEEAYKGQVIELAGIEKAETLNNAEVIRSKDYLLNKRIEDELKEQLKVNISGKFIAKMNKPISLEVSFNGHTEKVEGAIPLEATGEGTTKLRVIEQLNKTGEFPYAFEDIGVDMDKCFIPISEINKLKKEALTKLQESFYVENKDLPKPYENPDVFRTQSSFNGYFVENVAQKESIKENYVSRVFANSKGQNKLENRVTKNESFGLQDTVVHFFIDKENNDNMLIASPYCNITNSYALDCYYEHGFDQCILSFELDKESIKSLILDYKNRHNSEPNLGIVMYGKIDMMIMRSCPVGSFYKNKAIHCNKCHIHNYELIDRTSEHYRLIGDSECNVRILNNLPLYLLDKQDELNELGIKSHYFIFTDEDKEKVADILNRYSNKTKFDDFEFTRGHFNDRPL